MPPCLPPKLLSHHAANKNIPESKCVRFRAGRARARGRRPGDERGMARLASGGLLERCDVACDAGRYKPPGEQRCGASIFALLPFMCCRHATLGDASLKHQKPASAWLAGYSRPAWVRAMWSRALPSSPPLANATRPDPYRLSSTRPGGLGAAHVILGGSRLRQS